MKKALATFFLMAVMAISAQAQFQGVLKLTYESENPNQLINELNMAYQNPSVDILRKCNLGIGFRATFPLGIYAQVEGDLSVNTVWDSVAAISENFIEALGNSFSQTRGINLTVPVYVGWKFFDVGAFAARVFVGPEFHTTTDFSSFDYHTFSATAGVGIDLLSSVTLDIKATCLTPNKNIMLDRSAFIYGASLGLFF